jgi:hypothetical protein
MEFKHFVLGWGRERGKLVPVMPELKHFVSE